MTERYLFSYPDGAGFKEKGGTSQEAASYVDAKAHCKEVLSVLEKADRTADECAAELGRSVLSIRPRLSELFAKGLIRKTDLRRPNASGRNAVVWRRAQ